MFGLFPCKLSLFYSCCHQADFVLTEKFMPRNCTWETCSAAFTFTLNDLVMKQHEQIRLHHDENMNIGCF